MVNSLVKFLVVTPWVLVFFGACSQDAGSASKSFETSKDSTLTLSEEAGVFKVIFDYVKGERVPYLRGVMTVYQTAPGKSGKDTVLTAWENQMLQMLAWTKAKCDVYGGPETKLYFTLADTTGHLHANYVFDCKSMAGIYDECGFNPGLNMVSEMGGSFEHVQVDALKITPATAPYFRKFIATLPTIDTLPGKPNF